MKNNFKLLFFTLLIFSLLLSLSNVCAADFDDSTVELMGNDNTDEVAIDNSNQGAYGELYHSDLTADSDLNDLKTGENELNSKIYVNYADGNDDNSGKDWGSAVKTIEKSLEIVDDDGVIYIAEGVTYLSDSTSNDGITINKKVSIVGQGVNSVISGNNNKRIFNIGVDAEVLISNLTLTDGSATNGGAINIQDSGETSYGKLTIFDSIISNCYASSRGGAIYSDKGSISNLNNVTFINDTSISGGGAIAIQQRGSLSNINDCKFINNSAKNRGGAVYLGSNSVCDIGSNNLFENNNASGNYGWGGAIHGTNGISLGTGNVFVSNYAEKGSALSTNNNKQIIGSYCLFIKNYAKDDSIIYGSNAGTKIVLDYCYWATNSPDFSSFVNIGSFTHNNYLILTVSANDSVESGNKLPITVDLSKNQNNEAIDLNSLPNYIPVLFTTTNGDFDISSTELIEGVATTNYLAGNVGQSKVTVDVFGVETMLDIDVQPKAGTLFVNYTGGLDTNNGANWSSAIKTLSHALDIAVDDSTIYVASGINYLDDIDVNGLIISKNMTLIGDGDNVVIDAKNMARIFNIVGCTVNLSNLIFANADVSNASDTRGGVIWANNTILNIENCKFVNNTAGNSNSYGGAINLKYSIANIKGSAFDNNAAWYAGGAINTENTNILLNISNSIFKNNKILNKGWSTGAAICSYNTVIIDNSIFYNNTLANKTKKGKSINQYKDGSLTIRNSALLDGVSSVQVANASTALLDDNWWGNNNLNKDSSPISLDYTNGNVNSYLILETSINQEIVHVGDSVTIATSLNHNQNGEVVNTLLDLPIAIDASLGTVNPNKSTINNELSSIYNPTVSDNEVITVDVLGINNTLSFFVKNSMPRIVIDGVSTFWSSGIYPGVANFFEIKLINNMGIPIDNLTIELVSNESDEVLDSYIGTIDDGTSTISLVDKTIREITEETIWPDAQDHLIKFNVYLKYDGETLSTFSADKILAYNGYFNKTYVYGGHDNIVNRNYTINGDIIMATQDVGVYRDQYTLYRNETWNIKTPEDAEIVKVLLYFNYNWDTSFFPNGWTLEFNGHDILNEYISHEMDRGNLGVWGAYNYGLLVFDVTDFYNVNANNSFVINKTKYCALYPSTLYVLYNLTNSNTVKDVYFSDICDVYYPLYNPSGYDDLLKFVVNFNDVDLTNLIEANWYVFSGSSSLNNNLSFNNVTAVNPFAGYSPNDCRPYVYNVTGSISQNNEAWFISCPQSSTTVAYEQVLVVEKKVKTSIKFDFNKLNMVVGSKVTVNPTVYPAILNVTYISNDTSVATIDENGMITAVKSGKALITAIVGDGVEYPIGSTDFVVTVKKDTIIKIDSTSTRVAVDYSAGERGAFLYAVLKDIDGNVLSNKLVKITFNGVSHNVITDSQGRAGWKISVSTAKAYTYSVSFQGDDNYNAAKPASIKFTVTKKSTSIKASNKAFKAKTKSKKIKVTLKTVKNKVNGKTYLKKGKKITLRVNGKTYTAKTNAKGVAKFTIKLTKKGKFRAAIKFKGDKTYKACTKKILIRIK